MEVWRRPSEQFTECADPGDNQRFCRYHSGNRVRNSHRPGIGCVAGSDTLSSPYVDYGNDLAYVGNDIGVLYRIKNVFCTTTACANAAPSLDASWGTGGALTIGGTCTGKLTAPVQDAINFNIYVGCSDGKLYSISQTGTIKSLAVGEGARARCTVASLTPQSLMAINGFIYAVSGSANNAANGVLVQAKADFSSSVAVTIGAGNQCNMHFPDSEQRLLLTINVSWSLNVRRRTRHTGAVPQHLYGRFEWNRHGHLYGVTFGAGGHMNAGGAGTQLAPRRLARIRIRSAN